MFTLPEYEIIIEDEKLEISCESAQELEKKELLEFEKILQSKNPTFQNDDSVGDSLNQSVSEVQEDKMFLRFKEKMSNYPDQVLRYSKGDKPLWVSQLNIPTSNPNCELCGSKRKLEFQVNLALEGLSEAQLP